MSSIGNFGTPQIGPNGLVSFPGLISGVNTTNIINALLIPYDSQIKALQTQQSNFQTNITDWQKINTDISSLQTAANALQTASAWGAASATSSNSSVATATASNGTPLGTYSFTVQNLATSDTWISSGTVASLNTVVDANPGYLVSQGSQYGFATLTGSAGLAIGAHTVQVVAPMLAASRNGTTPLAQSVTITGANNQFVVNGTTYTIAAGTYTQSQLVSAVNSATGGGGTLATNGFNTSLVNGYLNIATNFEGAAASIQVTNGVNNALPTLGMTSMGAPVSGQNGSVTIDGTGNAGLTATYNPATGQTNSVALNGGNYTATFGAGLSTLVSAGTFTATNVTTAAKGGYAAGTLGALVADINAAGVGVTASAVQTGLNTYILQLSSNTTGTNAAITPDQTAFSNGLGTESNRTQTASNALLNVGGAYTVTSQTNAVTGLEPGLTVNTLSTGNATITVSQDVKGLTTLVQNLVNAANTLLTDMNTYAGYNKTTKVSGPLAGQSPAGQIVGQVLSTFATVTGTATTAPTPLSSAIDAGISVVYSKTTGQSTIQFNSATFQSTLQSNPVAVQDLFVGSVPKPGLAASLWTQSLNLTTQVTGAINELTTSSTALNSQITLFQNLETSQKNNLTTEFSQMEAMVGYLRNQGSYLQSAISSGL